MSMPEDPFLEKSVERLRADTPACFTLTHLNNAGTALSPTPVVDVVSNFLRLEQEIGGYEAEIQESDRLEAVYGSVAQLIGADASEIAIAQNATRAWDMLFYGIPLEQGDQILTCRNEYASNYMAFLQRQRSRGAEIVVLDNDPSGAVCPDSLRQHLCDRTRIVAINHIPTNGGVIQPAEALGEILQNHPAFYLLDACQSLGQVPLDVDKLRCDGLTATSRKYLRGPRGIGFLYLRQELLPLLEPPFIDLHAATWTSPSQYTFRPDARRFETYEVFVAGKLGLGRAAEYALALDGDWAFERLANLARMARTKLAQLDRVTVHDLGEHRGGIVTFRVEGLSPERIREALQRKKINIWTCTVRSARLDMEARNLEILARASFHYYNTEDEVDRLVEAVAELVHRLAV